MVVLAVGKAILWPFYILLLQNNPDAKSIPELTSVIAKHSIWINGKRFFLVPYHAIGSTSMESCILGGYADYIRKIHPNAPIPGVYLAEGLFQDAQTLRQNLGDTAFFDRLNEKNPQTQVGEMLQSLGIQKTSR